MTRHLATSVALVALVSACASHSGRPVRGRGRRAASDGRGEADQAACEEAAADEGARHRRRRRHPQAPAGRPGRDREARRLREHARPRRGQDQAQNGARGADLEARLRDAHRPDALQAAPPGDGAALPRGAPVDDVRRQRPAHEHARRDLDQAAVQGGLVARARLADRVSRGRLRGRRLHRELQGDDLRRLDAEREGRLEATTRPAGRWPPRRPSRTANVVVHGMDGSRARARPPQRPAALVVPQSARRSSPRR